MVGQDRKKFATIMATLAELFDNGKDVSETKMELYWACLEEYTIEAVQRAVTTIIKGRIYPGLPKPAEIREAINGLDEDVALKAWILVKHAMVHVGSYQSLRFIDPVVHSVVNLMGGWIKLCDTPSSELTWKQKEFERLYRVMSKQKGKHPDRLCGRVELENGAYYSDHVRAPELVNSVLSEAKALENIKR